MTATTLSPTARGRVAVDVSDDGVRLSEAVREPLVVSLDGQYVWSFSAVRDGRAVGAGVLVAWPEVLRRFLHGRAVVRVADVAGERVLLEEETSLGEAEDGARIRVVDPQGLPLAVDKVGHLCRSFEATDEGVRAEILRGTARALDHLRREAGVEAYLNYGALLGAVRDGAMIAHDSDTDVCYLSRHTSPADVIAESYRVERTLRRLGWRALRMSGGDVKLLLPLSDGRLCHIDVFVAFRVGETFYQLGNRSGTLPTSAVLPVSTISLHGHDFPAPADPEAMLAFVYGPGWRVPDPSFRYADPVAGVRRLDGWLRGFRTEMGQWTELHQSPRARQVPRTRSDFAHWVHRQLPRKAAVADLGAGTGRDTVYFATQGHPVRAYEFSRAAHARVERKVRRRGLRARVDLLVLGELRSVLLTAAELAHDQRRARGFHLYARQLVGCLDPTARANLWLLSRTALRRGGLLFLEFSATRPGLVADDPAPAGLVRRLDPDDLRREIEAAGGVVELEELGPGTDMLEGFDPLVARMRVSWPRRTPAPCPSAARDEDPR